MLPSNGFALPLAMSRIASCDKMGYVRGLRVSAFNIASAIGPFAFGILADNKSDSGVGQRSIDVSSSFGSGKERIGW
jgi:predicted MFS family arabinose efflux permease